MQGVQTLVTKRWTNCTIPGEGVGSQLKVYFMNVFLLYGPSASFFFHPIHLSLPTYKLASTAAYIIGNLFIHFGYQSFTRQIHVHARSSLTTQQIRTYLQFSFFLCFRGADFPFAKLLLLILLCGRFVFLLERT